MTGAIGPMYTCIVLPAQGQSEKDLAHFLQLLLGVAIHSEKKQSWLCPSYCMQSRYHQFCLPVHVQAIRNMDESIQMIVMSALQEVRKYLRSLM